MLGFKTFRSAQLIPTGIELIDMIRKGQFQFSDNNQQTPAEQLYRLILKISAMRFVTI